MLVYTLLKVANYFGFFTVYASLPQPLDAVFIVSNWQGILDSYKFVLSFADPKERLWLVIDRTN